MIICWYFITDGKSTMKFNLQKIKIDLNNIESKRLIIHYN